MITIKDLREQANGFSFTEMSNILPPATARRFLYREGYDPDLATMQRLQDAGAITIDIPLEIGSYEKMVDRFSFEDLRQISRDHGVSYLTLKYLKNRKRKRITLKEAIEIIDAIESAKTAV